MEGEDEATKFVGSTYGGIGDNEILDLVDEVDAVSSTDDKIESARLGSNDASGTGEVEEETDVGEVLTDEVVVGEDIKFKGPEEKEVAGGATMMELVRCFSSLFF